MLSNISWQQYWLYTGLATLTYYVIIVAACYRSEILALLSIKRKAVTRQAVSNTSALTDVQGAGKELSEENEYHPLSEAEEADALEVMQGLAEQIASVLGQFGSSDINKEALIQRLTLTVSDYGHTHIIHSFRETLRRHIREQVAAINEVQLGNDELYRIVPEHKTAWKPGATFLLAILISFIARAQDGNAGISEATSKVKGYFTTGCNLMYAIGAVVGLVGAVKVFNKWNSGEPDTGRVAAAWFGSCIFLVVVATVLKSFFNV